jgi:hypothetical protein
LLELVRLKVFYFMLLFALLIIGSSAFMVKFSFQHQFQVLKDVSLGAMSIFTWLLATLATAMLLPKDIEDRTLYTILAKPVPRLEYLLGKLSGVLLLLLIAILLMSGLFVAVLYGREQLVLAETMRAYSPGPELDAAVAEVRASTFNINLLPGSRSSTSSRALCRAHLAAFDLRQLLIFTIIVSVMMYLIGHVQPIAREYWLSQGGGAGDPSPVLKGFLGFVALIFPDFQALQSRGRYRRGECDHDHHVS